MDGRYDLLHDKKRCTISYMGRSAIFWYLQALKFTILRMYVRMEENKKK